MSSGYVYRCLTSTKQTASRTPGVLLDNKLGLWGNFKCPTFTTSWLQISYSGFRMRVFAELFNYLSSIL